MNNEVKLTRKEHRKRVKENKKYAKNKTINKNIPLNTQLEEVICIKATNVWKVIANEEKRFELIKGVSCQVYKNKFLMVFGESGSGKTTLLSLLSALDRPSEGIVNILNTNTPRLTNAQLTKLRNKHIGYIFQQYGLLKEVSVIENIIVTLTAREQNRILRLNHKLIRFKKKISNDNKLNNREKENKIIDYQQSLFGNEYWYTILKKLEIEKYINADVTHLSGGQQQRVSIARAIVKKPSILFADEPTGAVDALTAKCILELFLELIEKYNTTIVMVTHNANLIYLSDHYIILDSGKIIKDEFNKEKRDISEINFE